MPHARSELVNIVAALSEGWGPARQNRYKVMIPIPYTAFPESTYGNFVTGFDTDLNSPEDYWKSLLGNQYKSINRRLSFLCEAAVLPGKTIATNEARIYGHNFKVPYDQIFDDITLTFMCTNYLFDERRFFDAWMHSIVDPQTGDFNYKSEYAVTMDISQLGTDDYNIYGVKLYQAFPISVAAQELSYATNDDYHRVAVTFAYEKWINSEIDSFAAGDLGTLSRVNVSRSVIVERPIKEPERTPDRTGPPIV